MNDSNKLAEPPQPGPRSPLVTPDRLVILILVAVGLLWVSDRYGWFGFDRNKGWAVLIATASVGAMLLLMPVWRLAAHVFGWRYQFSIRSLLLIVLVVAVACGWLTAQIKSARRQQVAIEQIVGSGGRVIYVDREKPNRALDEDLIIAPDWLRVRLGNVFFADMVGVGLGWEVEGGDRLSDEKLARLAPYLAELPELTSLSLGGSAIGDTGLMAIQSLSQLQYLELSSTRVTDAGLGRLREMDRLQSLDLSANSIFGNGLLTLKPLKELHELNLGGTTITDVGLAHVTDLTQLERLHLDSTDVTDAGLRYLESLRHLKHLGLSYTKVTGDGLNHLARLSRLEVLGLDGNIITDAGVEHLAGMVQLKHLGLRRTGLTQDSLDRLKRSLPNCRIETFKQLESSKPIPVTIEAE